MSVFRDRQVQYFSLFIVLYMVLIFGAGAWLCQSQTAASKSMYLEHDRAVVSALLEQGVSKEVIAYAVSSTDTSAAGRELLDTLGMNQNTLSSLLPQFSQFQYHFWLMSLGVCVCLTVVLGIGILSFLRLRSKLYQQAEKIIGSYIKSDYSCHLPQNSEGEIFHLFASVEQLATMLQAKNETEHKTKEFLKSTISDISHQLKTPLAALTMYQEIIENEPDNPETVQEFSHKIEVSLKRIEQLVQSMLKITRLDSGNILFEKSSCHISELISLSINELRTRAESEQKQIIIEGNAEQQLVCDLEWTSEAIGNIVKNALDHVGPGGIIQITWERTPVIFRIFISDNGSGIAPEDIHHIFKRFYRSKHSLDTQGVGLGLALAKSIMEGQGGLISVQSEVNEGTTFTISFLTES